MSENDGPVEFQQEFKPNESIKVNLPEETQVRDQLVATAVKFLENPRVKFTSIDLKRKFLVGKGLTDAEIELAFQKSGVYEKQNVSQDIIPIVPGVPPRPYMEEYKLPFWMKVRDIANLVALLSIGSYSLYALWRRYISPYVFGTPTKADLKSQALLQSISTLNENINELKDLIRKLNLQQREASLAAKEKSASDFEELRHEISSIKSLLLGRSQFPISPGIPSWQMVEERQDRESSPEDVDKVEQTEKGNELAATRKHSSSGSRDSIGLHSDSSCEVVVVGKGKTNHQDSDHSD